MRLFLRPLSGGAFCPPAGRGVGLLLADVGKLAAFLEDADRCLEEHGCLLELVGVAGRRDQVARQFADPAGPGGLAVDQAPVVCLAVYHRRLTAGTWFGQGQVARRRRRPAGAGVAAGAAGPARGVGGALSPPPPAGVGPPRCAPPVPTE